jgi:Threonine dehydrogenase and related Zn-dependent dehydrogenases
MALQIAKAHGATVVVSGTNIDVGRLEMAAKLGADRIVNVQTEDLNEICALMTRGFGPDVVLECSGNATGIDTGLRLIKKRGYFVQVGLPGKKVEFDIEKVCYKELHFSGSLGSRNANWRKALQLMSEGKISLAPLATIKLPITEWEKAFELFEKKEGHKIFLLPV